MLARRLQGLGRGSRVALVAHTHPDFAVMFYACQYAALVPVPLPAAIHLGGREAYVRHLRQMVLDCRAVAAFAPAEFIDLLREASAGLPVQITGTLDDFHGAWKTWASCRRRPRPTNWPTCSTPRAARAFRAAR